MKVKKSHEVTRLQASMSSILAFHQPDEWTGTYKKMSIFWISFMESARMIPNYYFLNP